MESFDAKAYRAELLDAASHLEPFASYVSLRGDGAGQFLFAESQNGAIELSKTQHHQIFIEFWRSLSEEPAREETHANYESAVASAAAWLRAV